MRLPIPPRKSRSDGRGDPGAQRQRQGGRDQPSRPSPQSGEAQQGPDRDHRDRDRDAPAERHRERRPAGEGQEPGQGEGGERDHPRPAPEAERAQALAQPLGAVGLSVGGDEDRQQQVRQGSDPTEQDRDPEADPEDDRVDPEVAAEPAGHADDDAVAGRAQQPPGRLPLLRLGPAGPRPLALGLVHSGSFVVHWRCLLVDDRGCISSVPGARPTVYSGCPLGIPGISRGAGDPYWTAGDEWPGTDAGSPAVPRVWPPDKETELTTRRAGCRRGLRIGRRSLPPSCWES